MISAARFEELVAEGVKAIPEKFRLRLENVAILVEEEPTLEQRKKLKLRRDHDLFGLYEGIPQTKRGPNYFGVLPDKITIFRGPILAHARDDAEAAIIVRDTVWHEIAHHFGMDERTVRKREHWRGRSTRG